MKFVEHLGQFFGESVEPQELKALAMAAIAGEVRRLKLAIAAQVWRSRQCSGDAPEESAASLQAARELMARYQAALTEYGDVAGLDAAETVSLPGSEGEAA